MTKNEKDFFKVTVREYFEDLFTKPKGVTWRHYLGKCKSCENCQDFYFRIWSEQIEQAELRGYDAGLLAAHKASKKAK
jgi:hypothetical protein